MAAMTSHCASSAFLGPPLPNASRRHSSCCSVANAKPAPIAAALDTETTTKPGKSQARRSRKADRSASTALLALGELAETKNGGGSLEDKNAMVAQDDAIVNPVGLGRRSRQIFDEMSSTALAEPEEAILIRGGPMCHFTVPGAQDTTVLVVGATNRIVRKLMLRRYNVKEEPGGQRALMSQVYIVREEK